MVKVTINRKFDDGHADYIDICLPDIASFELSTNISNFSDIILSECKDMTEISLFTFLQLNRLSFNSVTSIMFLEINCSIISKFLNILIKNNIKFDYSPGNTFLIKFESSNISFWDILGNYSVEDLINI